MNEIVTNIGAWLVWFNTDPMIRGWGFVIGIGLMLFAVVTSVGIEVWKDYRLKRFRAYIESKGETK